MSFSTSVGVTDAIRALAFIGDLSMGQPTDHSLRTAWLAARCVAQAGGTRAETLAAQQVALLRWSGCTANAAGFAELLGNDVAGRAEMLAYTLEPQQQPERAADFYAALQPLSEVHCEVSGDIARTLGLGADIEIPLRRIFEAYDGGGLPFHRPQAEVPSTVYAVALASDLEILARQHGLPHALALVARKADRAYPAALVQLAHSHAADWLRTLDETDTPLQQAPDDPAQPGVALELVADVVDLKLPWMTGYSRRVASAARDCAAGLGLDLAVQQRCYRAALLHGMGRAAVPNTVWDTPGRLPASAWEQVRLAPYWTSRAARQIAGLAREAELASYAGERLDGSGHFRGCEAVAIPLPGQIIAAAAAWVALLSARPWRTALPVAQARAMLEHEATNGRFHPDAVRQLVQAGPALPGPRAPLASSGTSLTEREAEVLRGISLGQTNKEVARALDISPSTVRTHVESVFRKLACTTRAAATLKAATLRLL